MQLHIPDPQRDRREARIRLAFAGDFCLLGDAVKRSLEKAPDALVGPGLKARFSDADLAVINLESPIVSSDEPVLKSGRHVTGVPAMVDAVAAAGFGVVSAANNHILDHGPEAMRATRAACRDAGLDVIGIGEDEEEAARPAIRELGGLRVALLAFAEEEFSSAGVGRPGAARLDPATTARAIRAAREQADLVVLSVHGGNEYSVAPSPRMQSWYRFFVECGAHAVVGHHPHVVLGSEIHRSAAIVYSLGNFALDSPTPRPRAWKSGLVACIEFDDQGATAVELVPTRQEYEDGTLHVDEAQGEEREWALGRLARQNRIAADPEQVRAFWQCFVAEQSKAYRTRLVLDAAFAGPAPGGLLRAGLRSRAFDQIATALAQWTGRHLTRPRVREPRQARITNLFQCPARHELMTAILQAGDDAPQIPQAVLDEYQALIADVH